MIRINLLAVDRGPAKKARAGGITAAQRVTIGAALILLATIVTVGWWYWSLRTRDQQLDVDIAQAEKEANQLRSVLAQVQKFEARKAQLQQRVSLIEQLRRGQTGPVHVLDEISKALPPLMWLTALKQTPATSEVLIDGRGMTMTGLSDFVTNLEASGYFERSVEIVSTTTETNAAGELIKFQIKATFKSPTGKAAVAAPVAPRGA